MSQAYFLAEIPEVYFPPCVFKATAEVQLKIVVQTPEGEAFQEQSVDFLILPEAHSYQLCQLKLQIRILFTRVLSDMYAAILIIVFPFSAKEGAEVWKQGCRGRHMALCWEMRLEALGRELVRQETGGVCIFQPLW